MESESRSKLSLYRKDEQWDSIVEHRELYSISWDKPFVFQSLKSCPTLCDPTYARLPCPSPSPGACSNSCPLSQWCHPTISSSAIPFYPQSFPASVFSSESALHIRWTKYWSFSFSIASVIPMNIQGWFSLEFTGLTSLLSKGLSRVFSSTVWKHQFFAAQPSIWSSSHVRINHSEKEYT